MPIDSPNFISANNVAANSNLFGDQVPNTGVEQVYGWHPKTHNWPRVFARKDPAKNFDLIYNNGEIVEELFTWVNDEQRNLVAYYVEDPIDNKKKLHPGLSKYLWEDISLQIRPSANVFLGPDAVPSNFPGRKWPSVYFTGSDDSYVICDTTKGIPTKIDKLKLTKKIGTSFTIEAMVNWIGGSDGDYKETLKINQRTPGTYSYTVAAGDDKVKVKLVGGGGGGGGYDDNDGREGYGGFELEGHLDVDAGDIIQVSVGGGGQNGESGSGGAAGGAGGTSTFGFSGGSGSAAGPVPWSGGGGGGGAATVLKKNGKVIAVAPGGGGGGGGGNNSAGRGQSDSASYTSTSAGGNGQQKGGDGGGAGGGGGGLLGGNGGSVSSGDNGGYSGFDGSALIPNNWKIKRVGNGGRGGVYNARKPAGDGEDGFVKIHKLEIEKGDKIAMIVNKDSEYELAIDDDGTIMFAIDWGVGNDVNLPGGGWIDTGVQIERRVNTHIALVVDDTDAILYVNGEKKWQVSEDGYPGIPVTVTDVSANTAGAGSFTVGANVTSLSIRASGGGGGGGGRETIDGYDGTDGDLITGKITVAPGDVIEYDIGGGGGGGSYGSGLNGGSGGTSTLGYAGGTGGKSGATGSSGSGGGGGAATVIKKNGVVILVAGGGGGAAGAGAEEVATVKVDFTVSREAGDEDKITFNGPGGFTLSNFNTGKFTKDIQPNVDYVLSTRGSGPGGQNLKVSGSAVYLDDRKPNGDGDYNDMIVIVNKGKFFKRDDRFYYRLEDKDGIAGTLEGSFQDSGTTAGGNGGNKTGNGGAGGGGGGGRKGGKGGSVINGDVGGYNGWSGTSYSSESKVVPVVQGGSSGGQGQTQTQSSSAGRDGYIKITHTELAYTYELDRAAKDDNNPLYIGSRPSRSTNFIGHIGAVRFWKEARSANNIKDHIYSLAPGGAYYRLRRSRNLKFSDFWNQRGSFPLYYDDKIKYQGEQGVTEIQTKTTGLPINEFFRYVADGTWFSVDVGVPSKRDPTSITFDSINLVDANTVNVPVTKERSALLTQSGVWNANGGYFFQRSANVYFPDTDKYKLEFSLYAYKGATVAIDGKNRIAYSSDKDFSDELDSEVYQEGSVEKQERLVLTDIVSLANGYHNVTITANNAMKIGDVQLPDSISSFLIKIPQSIGIPPGDQKGYAGYSTNPNGSDPYVHFDRTNGLTVTLYSWSADSGVYVPTGGSKVYTIASFDDLFDKTKLTAIPGRVKGEKYKTLYEHGRDKSTFGSELIVESGPNKNESTIIINIWWGKKGDPFKGSKIGTYKIYSSQFYVKQWMESGEPPAVGLKITKSAIWDPGGTGNHNSDYEVFRFYFPAKPVRVIDGKTYLVVAYDPDNDYEKHIEYYHNKLPDEYILVDGEIADNRGVQISTIAPADRNPTGELLIDNDQLYKYYKVGLPGGYRRFKQLNASSFPENVAGNRYKKLKNKPIVRYSMRYNIARDGNNKKVGGIVRVYYNYDTGLVYATWHYRGEANSTQNSGQVSLLRLDLRPPLSKNQNNTKGGGTSFVSTLPATSYKEYKTFNGYYDDGNNPVMQLDLQQAGSFSNTREVNVLNVNDIKVPIYTWANSFNITLTQNTIGTFANGTSNDLMQQLVDQGYTLYARYKSGGYQTYDGTVQFSKSSGLTMKLVRWKAKNNQKNADGSTSATPSFRTFKLADYDDIFDDIGHPIEGITASDKFKTYYINEEGKERRGDKSFFLTKVIDNGGGSAKIEIYWALHDTVDASQRLNYLIGNTTITKTGISYYRSIAPLPVSWKYGSNVAVFGYNGPNRSANEKERYLRALYSNSQIDLRQEDFITYMINMGTESDWGQIPDTSHDENLYLQYSSNNRVVDSKTKAVSYVTQWTTIDTVKPKDLKANKWTLRTVTVPNTLRTTDVGYGEKGLTTLRYAMVTRGGGTDRKGNRQPRDTYAVTSIVSNTIPIYLRPDTLGAPDGKVAVPTNVIHVDYVDSFANYYFDRYPEGYDKIDKMNEYEIYNIDISNTNDNDDDYPELDVDGDMT